MTAGAVAAQVGARSDVASSEAATNWREIAKIGLIGGAIALYLCLVGIVPVFHARQLIAGVITLGQVALFGSMAVPGAFAARRARTTREAVLAGGAAGLITGGALTLLVVVGGVVDLRAMFLNASPELYSMLTMGLGMAGAWIPAVEVACPGRRGRGVRAAPGPRALASGARAARRVHRRAVRGPPPSAVDVGRSVRYRTAPVHR